MLIICPLDVTSFIRNCEALTHSQHPACPQSLPLKYLCFYENGCVTHHTSELHIRVGLFEQRPAEIAFSNVVYTKCGCLFCPSSEWNGAVTMTCHMERLRFIREFSINIYESFRMDVCVCGLDTTMLHCGYTIVAWTQINNEGKVGFIKIMIWVTTE